MQKLVKLPLVFLFIASLIGLVLRWHYFQPIVAFKYPFWLHAHSHLMFLGWVFNALSIGYVICFLPESAQRRYKGIFYTLNLLVLGMLISFPLQGYGVYSIAISTLHTAVVVIYCLKFFKDTISTKSNISIWFARVSLSFFLISAIGPFVVGVLAAKGLGQSDGYHLAVYYYLHFQYNGVFTFGVFALFFHLLTVRGIDFHLEHATRFGWLLFFSCFPAYALSSLWTNPPLIANWIGLLAAGTQVIAFYYFLKSINRSWPAIGEMFTKPSRLLLIVSLVAFGAKLLLQLLSVHPSIAVLAYEIRFYVIAYLHLVLIGMISLFLIVWYKEWNLLPLKRLYIYLLLIGFISSELVMISIGWWPGFFNIPKWMVITSVIMAIGITGIIYDFLFTPNTKVLSNEI